MSNSSFQEQEYKKAKITSSILTHTSRLIINEDRIRFLDGKEKTYYIVSHRGAAAVLPIDSEGNIYLVKQYRHVMKCVTLEIPAGLVDAGEDPLTAAKRELREETHMDATSFSSLGTIWTTPGFSNEVIHLFLAEGLFHSPLQGEDTHEIDVVKFPIKKAKAAMQDGTFQDAKTIAALSRYFMRDA